MTRRIVTVIVLVAAACAAWPGCGGGEIDGRIGARCATTADCDQRCLEPSGDHPGGFCSVSCTTDGDCAKDGTACVDDEGGVCLFTCRDDRDCAFLSGDGTASWVCKERDHRGGGVVLVCRGD